MAPGASHVRRGSARATIAPRTSSGSATTITESGSHDSNAGVQSSVCTSTRLKAPRASSVQTARTIVRTSTTQGRALQPVRVAPSSLKAAISVATAIAVSPMNVPKCDGHLLGVGPESTDEGGNECDEGEHLRDAEARRRDHRRSVVGVAQGVLTRYRPSQTFVRATSRRNAIVRPV